MLSSQDGEDGEDEPRKSLKFTAAASPGAGSAHHLSAFQSSKPLRAFQLEHATGAF